MQWQYEYQFVVCALSAVRRVQVQIVTFYVLINSALVGKNSFVLMSCLFMEINITLLIHL